MAYDNKQQEDVFRIFKESWADFKDYYQKEKEKYSQNGVEGHVICWKEDDIVLQLGRFFYNRLTHSELKDACIEFHSQTIMSNYTFPKLAEKLSEANKILERKRGIKPDFIITKEDTDDLWLIGEVKYIREFHPFLKEKGKDRIDKDIKELKVLKELGICQKTAYLVADDFLHHKENESKDNNWFNLQDRLNRDRLKTEKQIDFSDLVVMCSRIKCNGISYKFN
jgi:hypothetical protein